MIESFYTDDLWRIALSMICGSIIGFEREYKNKSAGFRTMILICLGSTIFSIISRQTGDDRIASTVVTGIGFIGAGVIFKDNLWVKGLTTSAVIWVTAAIGMLIGMGNSLLGFIVTLCALSILSVFHYVERFIDMVHHRKQFSILFVNNDLHALYKLEQEMNDKQLQFKRVLVSKKVTGLYVVIDIVGNKKKIHNLNEHMVSLPQIASFEVV